MICTPCLEQAAIVIAGSIALISVFIGLGVLFSLMNEKWGTPTAGIITIALCFAVIGALVYLGCAFG